MSLDIAGLALLAGFDALVFLGWLVLLIGRPWPLAEIVLAAFTGWLCQIIGTELLLGLAGRLAASWLIGVNLTLTLLLIGYGARRLARADLLRQARVFGAALAFGGYWYLLNMLRFGNPLWPFPVRVGAHTIFAGLSPPFAEDMYRDDLRYVAHTPPGLGRLRWNRLRRSAEGGWSAVCVRRRHWPGGGAAVPRHTRPAGL